jgi:hypothetical protein
MAGAFDDLIPTQSTPGAPPQAAPLGSDANPFLLGPNDAAPPAGVSYVTPGGVHWHQDGRTASLWGGVAGGQPQAPPLPPQAPPPQAQAAPPASSTSMFSDLIPSAGTAPATDFREPGVLGAANSIARTLARGVPILGQAADYADAATNATLAPIVEPVLDMIPGHDRKWDIAGGKTWQDRYDRAFAMQRGMDAQVDKDQPVLSAGGQFLGGGLGILASGGVLTPATGALARLAPAAGMIPKMAAGALDGALLGAGTGYLQGDGGLDDPSRFQGAERDAIFGGLAGGAAQPVLGVAKGVWNATGSKLLDALMGRATIGGPPAPASDLAAALTQRASAADAFQGVEALPGGATDLADALAARASAPTFTGPRSAVNGAYDRVLQAIQRSGQSPAEALDQAQTLGPFGMLADTGVPMSDLARAIADAPGEGGQIAADTLNLRQAGLLENGQWNVRPSSQRIGDTLAQTLGVSGRTAAADTEGLLASQKASAGPAYAAAYEAAPVPVSELSDFSSSPMFQAAYDRARAISQREFVTMPDGTERLQPLPQLDLTAPSPRALIAGPDGAGALDQDGLNQALADVRLYGDRRSGSLFSAVRSLGGIRTTDAAGNRFMAGPDLDPLASRYPGLINNRSGMSPENMAQALQEEGWFGPSLEEDPSKPFETAWNREVRGDRVYHPDAAGVDYNYNRAMFEQEAADAGVGANDSPQVAARKLWDYRNFDQTERAAIQAESDASDPFGQEFDRLSAPRGQALDWRSLDLMKQGMDDLIREGRVQGIGANEQAATKGYLARFVAKLDSLNPAYSSARAAYAGPAKLMDAIDAGRAYMGEDAPAIASAMADMSPSEQEAFRVGALQSERDRLGSVPVTRNAAERAGVATPTRLEKLRQLFPDDASFARYANFLQGENTMFATRARVLGGSQTARNLIQAEDADHNPLELIASGVEAAHEPAVGGLRILTRLLQAGNGRKLDPQTANATASILFNMNPEAFPDFSAGLSAAANRAALVRALGGTTTPAASVGAVSLKDALAQRGAHR